MIAEEYAEQNEQKQQLTEDQYLNALRHVNFLDYDSLSEFVSLSKPLDYAGTSDRIRFGVENGIHYFLRPQPGICNIMDDLDPSVKRHPFLVEFRGRPNTVPPVKYGLHLGVLEYASQTSGGLSAACKTPLHIFVNPFDRSLWLVLDREFMDDLGDPVYMTEETDVWSYCAAERGSRPLFDVIRISSGEEVMRATGNSTGHGLGGEREMFPPSVVAWAQLHQLQPYAASKLEVESKLAAAASGEIEPAPAA